MTSLFQVNMSMFRGSRNYYVLPSPRCSRHDYRRDEIAGRGITA